MSAADNGNAMSCINAAGHGNGAGRDDAPAVSGAWRSEQGVGNRRFADLCADEPLSLERGATLDDVQVAYETWGRLDAKRSNAVLVAHALTGDSHVAGAAGPGHPTPGWWDGLVGPGKAIDTRRFCVVCPNVLGGCQGSTGPASPASDGRPYGSRFPAITIRDQVMLESRLADFLGIDRWAAVIGGSMGGMRALEWAIMFPERTARAIVIAVGAAATAEQIALSLAQIRAIELDGAFRGGDYYDAPPGGGPHVGMGLARWIGHVSYRSEPELQARFGHEVQSERTRAPRYRVESYLDHQADKLARRFDANTYIVLSKAMNGHDVGRGRGGIEHALGCIETNVTLIGIDGDRLYPLRLLCEIADVIPRRCVLEVMRSIHGHDAFLIETQAVGAMLSAALARPERARHASWR